MSSHKNRVKMTVSGTPGTGTITLSAASSGYQSLATAYGANATVDVLITEGTAWEVARDCAYTHSGTTLSRGTLEESSTGSAVSFTSAAVVSVIATADRGRTWDSAALNTQATGTDANTTMVVNTMYVVDMSAWATADRTYTLPATAAVGDRIGVMVTAGDASHELILTAGTGDTLNGIAGGTEWSRLFITNEVVVMRCIVANTTWVVEYDGRIPSYATGYPNDISTNSANTATVAPLVNAVSDSGGMLDTATNFRINIRRAGNYEVNVSMRGLNNPSAAQNQNVYAYLNGASLVSMQMKTASTGVEQCAVIKDFPLAAGDYIQLYFLHTQANMGIRGNSTVSWCGVAEIL